MKRTISMIVAMANNRVIGKGNDMPWNLPADLKHFQQITNNHSIIMGRKTYESIGKALPNRRNIVISSNKSLKIEGVEVVNSMEEALSITENENEVFIIGGGKIYQDNISIANKLYITRIDLDVEGDTFFPEYINLNVKKISEINMTKDGKNKYNYTFLEYTI